MKCFGWTAPEARGVAGIVFESYPIPREASYSLTPPWATGSQSVCAVFLHTVLSDTESVAFGCEVESLSANSIRWLSCRGSAQYRRSTQCGGLKAEGWTPEAARCPGASQLADPADPSAVIHFDGDVCGPLAGHPSPEGPSSQVRELLYPRQERHHRSCHRSLPHRCG
jgi:hypothetical protein